MDIVISGCNGKLGQVITRMATERGNMQVVAGVDINEKFATPFPVFASFKELPLFSCRVIVDASNPVVLKDLLTYALEHKIALVLATTGYGAEHLAMVEEASKEIPIFISTNMSIGINLLCELAKTAARVLGGSFDVEIVEAHHNQKLDAPSGTALTLAGAIAEGLSYEPEYTYERHSRRQKRNPREIGLHAVRGGTIVGEHEIIFAGHDEVVKLSHSAMSKEIFAVGALDAAEFIANQPVGKYSMKDMVSQ
ncbi:MAG: 4-hydroxy-tetrahydrodipicolinate reductase [Oscillospiraceae bacterium]|jgi:4-hydroxy-tetrahydrodipicolinate reductase|nr:4-hydroxy-tetrahydrodipicolinate reductase [Oscillospiraceae bacterium]